MSLIINRLANSGSIWIDNILMDVIPNTTHIDTLEREAKLLVDKGKNGNIFNIGF